MLAWECCAAAAELATNNFCSNMHEAGRLAQPHDMAVRVYSVALNTHSPDMGFIDVLR